jgi:TPR repeat protein
LVLLDPPTQLRFEHIFFPIAAHSVFNRRSCRTQLTPLSLARAPSPSPWPTRRRRLPPAERADGPPSAAADPEEGASSSVSSAFAPPTHPAAAGKSCALCGADFSNGKRLMRCGGCRAAHYCSREHQAAHWDAHARECAAEVARREAQEQSGGLVLGAEAARARSEEKAAAAAAAEAAEDRARIEKLDAAALRLELDRRGALAGLPVDASREALVAARLCAPSPTPETLSAAAEREDRASLLRRCRLCEALMPEEPVSVGRCAACKRVRYCGVACQKADWPRHKPECKAWKDAEVVASGGCPLGDLKAQEEAIRMWVAPERTLAQFLFGGCFEFGYKGSPKDAAEAVKWYRCSSAGNLAWAQYNLGCCYDSGRGVALDLAEAARLWALSAAQGYANRLPAPRA